MPSPVAAQDFIDIDHQDPVNALAVDGEGWLFAGYADGRVIRWETWPGAAVAAIFRQRKHLAMHGHTLPCLRAAAACRYHPTVKYWKQDFLKAEDIIQGIVVTAAQEVYVGLHSGTILR